MSAVYPIVIACGLAALPGVAIGQDQLPTFSVDTKLVQVDIQVTERASGRIIRGLKSDDFQILDEVEPRLITLFEFESTPVDAVLILDITGAVGRSRNHDYFNGLQSIVKELRPGDRLAVVTVGRKKVELRVPLTNDEENVRNAIVSALRERASMRQGNRPLLYEALEQAAIAFDTKTRSPRRRAVLVMTHNRAKYDSAKVERAISALLERNATVLGMVVPMLSRQVGTKRKVGLINPLPRPEIIWERYPPQIEETLPETGSLDPVADQTGGEILRLKADGDPEWVDIMERVRLRYLTGFHAPDAIRPGEVRSIRVRLTANAHRRCGDCVIRCRNRYTAR